MHGFDPANRLVFTTGPLTGTLVPASSDWTVTTLRRELEDRLAGGHEDHGMMANFEVV